jgi:3-oxoacyl-[acyl-carrier protein] reductase
MIDFSNKTAVVTGGTRGIGKKIADLLCIYGCYTIITGTKDEKQVNHTNKNLHYVQLNFQKKDTVETFLENINKLKSIEILVNNAGINIIEPIDELNLDNWEKAIQTNLTGPLILIKNIAKIMKLQKYGRIVNISSIFGIISREKRNSYSATKAGLIGLTRSAALDLAKDNILVNAVCPGFTKTELTLSILSLQEQEDLSKEIPLGRFAEAHEIAKTVLFLCSDWNTYITGQIIVIDGGYTIK